MAGITVCIAASEHQKRELIERKKFGAVSTEWVTGTAGLLQSTAAFLIDCTFSGSYLPATNKPLLIHSPFDKLAALHATGPVARFCAWQTFLQRPVWEIALQADADAAWLEAMMKALDWKFLLVKDEPGLIAPRIISRIIEEAQFALQEGVSSKTEIDIAMQLGTNYPYGPFEWADKIGTGLPQ